MTETARLTAFIGPTASGKSARAMAFANETPGAEIVAVDAYTVYAGMDIGTAKPTAADRAAVPHHMVDVLTPADCVTVAWFQEQARAAIDGILGRGGHPVLVGGSGLYWRAVVDSIDFPPTNEDVRAELEDAWLDQPVDAHETLRLIDPEAAAKIEPGNVRRTIRALEVIEITGQLFSSFRTSWDDYTSRWEGLQVHAVDRPDDTLDERIRLRVEQMLADGLLEEARAIRETFDVCATARQAIGYAEAWAHLDGELAAEDLVEAIAVRTRRYARRQRKWFCRDPRWQTGAGLVR